MKKNNLRNLYFLFSLVLLSCNDVTKNTSTISTASSPISTSSVSVSQNPSPLVSISPSTIPTTIESIKPNPSITPSVSISQNPSSTVSPVLSIEEQNNLKVKSIIDNRCSKCHSGIKTGGYDFKELKDVINSKSTIKSVIKSGKMPPNNSMTKEELNFIDKW
ncbi:MAG: hypothetical protein U0354_10680 [Candidatus Sericytochromatia bacterium]